MSDYPWLKNYDKGVPPTLQPYPQKTMIEVVDESAKAKPYRAMLYFKGSKVLYADFIRLSVGIEDVDDLIEDLQQAIS